MPLSDVLLSLLGYYNITTGAITAEPIAPQPDVAVQLQAEIFTSTRSRASTVADIIRHALDDAATSTDPYFTAFTNALCGVADCSGGVVLSSSVAEVQLDTPGGAEEADGGDVIGGAVGGVLGAACCCYCLILFCLRRRQRKDNKEQKIGPAAGDVAAAQHGNNSTPITVGVPAEQAAGVQAPTPKRKAADVDKMDFVGNNPMISFVPLPTGGAAPPPPVHVHVPRAAATTADGSSSAEPRAMRKTRFRKLEYISSS